MARRLEFEEAMMPAERAIIGAAMMNELFLDRFAARLTPEMFSKRHATMWRVIVAIWDASATTDTKGPRVDKSLVLMAAPSYHVSTPHGYETLEDFLQACIDEFDNIDQASRYANEVLRRSAIIDLQERMKQWQAACMNGAVRCGGEEGYEMIQRQIADGLSMLRNTDERFRDDAIEGVRFAPSIVLDPARHKPGYTLLLSEVAPKWCADYIAQLSLSVDGVPVEFAFSVWLSTICGAFSMFHRLEAKTGYVLPPCIYVQCVLISGAGKDAIINGITAPITASLNRAIMTRRNAMNNRIRVALTAVKMRLEGIKGRKSALKRRRAQSELETDPAELAAEELKIAEQEVALEQHASALSKMHNEPELLTDSASVEALVHCAAKNPGNMLFVIASEATVLTNAISYSSNSTPNLGPLLKGIDGAPCRAHRVNKDSEVVLDKIVISMCLGTQPDTFARMCKNPHFIEQGLLWRFMICAPKFDGKDANNISVEPYVRDMYMKHMEELILPLANYDIVNIPPIPGDENADPPAEEVVLPKIIGMSQAARDAHNRNRKQLFDKAKGSGAPLVRWQSIVYKADANALKVAAALHFVEHPTLLAAETSLVSAATVEKAWKIVRFYLEHAICIYTANSVDASSRDQKMHTLILAMRLSRKGPYHQWTIQDIKKLCEGRTKESKRSDMKLTGVRLLNTISLAELQELLIRLQNQAYIEIRTDGANRMPRYVLTEQGRKYDPSRAMRSSIDDEPESEL